MSDEFSCEKHAVYIGRLREIDGRTVARLSKEKKCDERIGDET